MAHNSTAVSSEPVREDEDGEKAVGAASRKVAKSRGCSWV